LDCYTQHLTPAHSPLFDLAQPAYPIILSCKPSKHGSPGIAHFSFAPISHYLNSARVNRSSIFVSEDVCRTLLAAKSWACEHEWQKEVSGIGDVLIAPDKR
jgi:hypothetical protein